LSATVVQAALERVAATPVQVEAGTARDQDLQAIPVGVVQALQEVAPAPELVQLVERDQSGAWKVSGQDSRPGLVVVPVEVALRRASVTSSQ
jgi:hypothetical protein